MVNLAGNGCGGSVFDGGFDSGVILDRQCCVRCQTEARKGGQGLREGKQWLSVTRRSDLG